MKNLVMYYSYTGNSRKYAETLAKNEGCELCEITELKSRGKLQCYTVGCFQALRGASSAIKPPQVNLLSYDTITIVSPVWAGKSAPAINAAIELLPAGKRVKLVLVSMSGEAQSARTEARIREKKCTVLGVEHVKM